MSSLPNLHNAAAARMMHCNNSQSLLEEWKAKEAAVNAHRHASEAMLHQMLSNQARIKQRIDEITGKDSRWWPELTSLQNQMNMLDQQILVMRANQNVNVAKSEKDPYSKFFAAVAQYVSRCVNRTCLICEVVEEKNSQREWTELVRSRIVRKSQNMIEVLRAKTNLFEMYEDTEGRHALRFKGETGTVPVSRSSMMQVSSPSSAPPMLPNGPQMGAGGANPMMAGGLAMRPMLPLPAGAGTTAPGSSMALALPAAPGTMNQAGAVPMPILVPPLTDFQVASVEAELLRAGGSERLRRILLHCGVQEQQLARRFRLYDHQGKQMVSHMNVDLSRLEEKLFNLTTARASVCEAMTYCLEHAALHAAAFARDLVMSLEVKSLDCDKVIARLFVLSDVLFNSNSGAKGAGRYRAIFEELLPDAFDRLGRGWLSSFEEGSPERERAESAARRVLHAWRTWDVFPSVFVMGLESLLLSPAPDPEPAMSGQPPSAETSLPHDDAVLRQKLAGWEEAAPSEAKSAARRRGLAGDSNLPVAVCRLRLCHYERYWHRMKAEEEAAALAQAQAARAEAYRLERRLEDSSSDAEMGSIDGEPLSDGDIEMANAFDGEAMPSEAVGLALADEVSMPKGRGTPALQWLRGGLGGPNGRLDGPLVKEPTKNRGGESRRPPPDAVD